MTSILGMPERKTPVKDLCYTLRVKYRKSLDGKSLMLYLNSKRLMTMEVANLSFQDVVEGVRLQDHRIAM